MRLLAYSVDHDGSEVYRLRVRDLTTGDATCRTSSPAPTTALALGGGRLRASSTRRSTTRYRPDRVCRHVLGTSQADDVLVWHEEDRRFELEVERDAQR